jgi:two-component system sensor histidine kinase UhpB
VTPETFSPSFRTVLKSLHPSDGARVEKLVAHAVQTRTPFSCEYRVIRPDGEVRTVHARGAWASDLGPARETMYGTAQDVTTRRQTEGALVQANRRVRTLAGRMLQVQENERRHIARELHDEIGQALTAVQIAMQRLRRRTDSPDLQSDIDQCVTIAAHVLDQVRSLTLDLRPPHLDDLGLEAAIGWLLSQHCEPAGLTARLDARGVPRSLASEVEIVCFRVAQEAVTNIVRHAHASTVAVELYCEKDALTFVIEDDGRGFDVKAALARAYEGASMGLLGMEERAALAGGGVTIKSGPHGGTRIAAWFPLNSAAQLKRG